MHKGHTDINFDIYIDKLTLDKQYCNVHLTLRSDDTVKTYLQLNGCVFVSVSTVSVLKHLKVNYYLRAVCICTYIIDFPCSILYCLVLII